MKGLFAFWADLLGKESDDPLSAYDVLESQEPLADANTEAEEQAFMQRYDDYCTAYLGAPVKAYADLYANMMVAPGMWGRDGPVFYWIPADHPLTLPLRNAWMRERGVVERLISTRRAGACAVYAEPLVHASAEGVAELFERYGRALEGAPEAEPE